MSAEAAAAIASGVASLGKIGFGIGQSIRARKLAKRLKDINYAGSQELQEGYDMAKNRAQAATLYGLPGQGQLANQNQSSLATALRAYQDTQQSPASMLSGITALNQNQLNANAKLAMDAANYRASNMANTANQFYSTGARLGENKLTKFRLNELRKDEAARKEIADLRSGGTANIYGGVDEISKVASAYIKKSK